MLESAMRFDVLTLFPGLFAGVFEESIVKRAVASGLASIHLHNLRDYATDKHHVTDDIPYGGGGGMVMKVEPIYAALEYLLGGDPAALDHDGPLQVILLSPTGRVFSQAVARELAGRERLVLLCGRYEGVDERVREHLVTDEISIGDYVLSGGEIPAMVLIEGVTRLLPGALGDPLATAQDSHTAGLLEHPHYTRPAIFRGWPVPDQLLSGNHAEVQRWRREQSLRRTLQLRPDLLARAPLSQRDREYLQTLGADIEPSSVTRDVSVDLLSQVVSQLLVSACYELPPEVVQAIESAASTEASATGRVVLRQILENAEIARHGEFPLCQDTGVAVVFLEVGQDVHWVGGSVECAVTEGVRRAYREGYLRKSMVRSPYAERINTGDNTPPILHVSLVPGDRVRVQVMVKGAGSENTSRLHMLRPADGRQGVIDVVVRTVDEAGASACPPLIVGVGIGGTAEHAMLLAKQALLRPLGQSNPDAEDNLLERELLQRINALGIGPAGLGGETTALAVHVSSFPCHMASLPVAVNLQCHSARRQEAVI